MFISYRDLDHKISTATDHLPYGRRRAFFCGASDSKCYLERLVEWERHSKNLKRYLEKRKIDV
jgi:hypothetical protein